MARNIDKEEISAEIEEPMVDTTAPRKKQYKVISYNSKSNIIVLERDGQRIQSNCIEYDGVSGYIEI